MVIVNVYDLNNINEYLWQIGLGAYHSGVEIEGREFSFGAGSGVFEMTAREVPGIMNVYDVRY